MIDMKRKQDGGHKSKTASKSLEFVKEVKKRESRPVILNSIRYLRVSDTSGGARTQQKYYHYGIQ